MSCPKHGTECPNVARLMDAYKARGELRTELATLKSELQRLRLRLAAVGSREPTESPYSPPEARVPCGAHTAEGPCPTPAPLGGHCAAHVAGEVL